MQSTKEKIIDILRTHFDFVDYNFKDSTNIIEDLEFDSIMIVEFINSLEEAYEIELLDFINLVKSMERLDKFIAYINELI